jgi:hypothetical protein
MVCDDVMNERKTPSWNDDHDLKRYFNAESEITLEAAERYEMTAGNGDLNNHCCM